MRIPVTGHPDIDAKTVQAVMAYLHLRTQVVAHLAGLRTQVEGMRVQRWARRQRVLLRRRVERAARVARDRMRGWRR